MARICVRWFWNSESGQVGDPILLGLPTSRIERTTSQRKSFALRLSRRKLASTINLPSSISGVIFAAACIKCNSCNRIPLELSCVTKFIEIQTVGTATKLIETYKLMLKTLKEGLKYKRRHGWIKIP